MPKSVLDAIKLGQWDFGPSESAGERHCPTDAMPGTREKLRVLAERIRAGLPLWHPHDRDDLDAPRPLIHKPR